jgi:hypothetical protein
MQIIRQIMRWFEVNECDNCVPEPYVSDSDDLRGYEGWQLRSGEIIAQWDEKAWIKCTDEKANGDPDDALQNHLGIPVFSFRLHRALDYAGIAGIQYLPIRVLRPDNSEIPGYAVANITNKVAALDLQKSEYDLYDEEDDFAPNRQGQIFSLWRAVLKKKVVSGLHVVRLAEYPEFLVVSASFKEAFEGVGCTGYSFEEVDLS